MTAPGGPRPVRAWACLGLLLGVPLQPLLLRAAEPPAKVIEPADADLIEFLGSVDSDDEGWKQYLARTSARVPVVKAPPPAPPASSAPGKDSAKVEH
ncbi:MAG TPA: hypothetical protein VHW25_03260 [Steroidobacteraceae bacterium]|jgi:hypothetical protein|nr:hypothetical protein [Steroidobacteraceae bacterium]